MKYLKIGIVALAFILPASLAFAQDEPVPTLYDDSAPVPELISEEGEAPVPELISEEGEAPAPELINEEEEEVPVAAPAGDEESTTNMWYWIIGFLVVVGLVLMLSKRGKTETPTDAPTDAPTE